MTVRRLIPWALVAALVLGAPATASISIEDGTVMATTQGTVNSCTKAATKGGRICLQAAMEATQVATDACLNRNHDCVEVCRANRCDCAEATGFEDGIRTCSDALDARRLQCRALYALGTLEWDACVDQAQVKAFVCRDNTREAAKAAMKLCRTNFKACGRACGPPDPLDPVNLNQCRFDANAANAAAKAVCVEDVQLEKDICKNRNHVCVEVCRATRDGCATPVLDALELAKDACRATRDGDVADCRIQFADGTPELDACIDQAQVEAFLCRDAEHELAWPDLQACRQDFRTCAQACPAP